MASSTAGDSRASPASIAVFSCAMPVAPMMAEVTKGRLTTKAMASVAGSRPASRAIAT